MVTRGQHKGFAYLGGGAGWGAYDEGCFSLALGFSCPVPCDVNLVSISPTLALALQPMKHSFGLDGPSWLSISPSALGTGWL